MKYLLASYLLLVPSFYWWGKPMRESQELAYQMLGMILFFCLFFVKKRVVKLTKVSLTLSIFCLWTACIYMLGKCTIGFNYLHNVFVFAIIYFVTLSCYKKENFNLIRNCVLWIFFLNTIYIVSQGFGYDIIGFVNNGSPDVVPTDTGLFALPAHYGIYAGIAICMLSQVHPIIALLLFGFLAVSKSSAAIGAAVIAYLYILWVRRFEVKFVIPYFTLKKQKWFIQTRKIFVPFFFLAVILIGTASTWYIVKVDAPMGMFSTRPPAWKLMITDALKHPAWGWGLGAIRQGNIRYVKDAGSDVTVRSVRVKDDTFRIVESEAVKYNLPHNSKVDIWDNTHNEYINLLYHFSVLGVILVGFLLYFLYKRLENVLITPEIATLVGIMIIFLLSSVTQFPFSVARLAHLVPIVLGMYMVHTTEG